MDDGEFFCSLQVQDTPRKNGFILLKENENIGLPFEESKHMLQFQNICCSLIPRVIVCYLKNIISVFEMHFSPLFCIRLNVHIFCELFLSREAHAVLKIFLRQPPSAVT